VATKKKKAAEENPGIDFSGDAGMGFENVDQTDLGIPFLAIAQKLSPEVDADHPKYIEGAEAGVIFNTQTREVLGGRGEPVTFVPVHYQKAYVEWQPRESGGGFRGAHTAEILTQCTRDERGRDVLPNGNLIVTTAYILGFVIDEDGDHTKAVISLTSTQLKKARQWLNMMMSIKLTNADGDKFTPPMFSHKYRLSTQPESNDMGSWHGWKIEQAGMVGDQNLVAEAREAAKNPMISSVVQGALPAHNGEEETPF